MPLLVDCDDFLKKGEKLYSNMNVKSNIETEKKMHIICSTS